MTTYQDVTSMVRRPAPVCRWIGALAFLKGWQNEIYGSSEEFVGKLTARSSTAKLRQQRFTRKKTRKTTTTAALSSFRFCHLNDRPNQPCPKMSGLNMLRHGRNLLKRRVLTLQLPSGTSQDRLPLTHRFCGRGTIHGEDDPVVPYSQTVRLHDA